MLFIRDKLTSKSIFFSRYFCVFIFQSGFFVMRIYFNCENSGSADKCKIGKMSGLCAEYARKKLVDCNLAFFFPVQMGAYLERPKKKKKKLLSSTVCNAKLMF